MTDILLWTCKFSSGAMCAILLEGGPDEPIIKGSAVRIEIQVNTQMNIFRLPLRAGWKVPIPQDIITKNNVKPRRVLRWDEISGTTAPQGVTIARQQIDDLRSRLTHLEVDADAFGTAAISFFGVCRIADKAFVDASVALDLPGLRPPEERAATQIVLTAIAEAEIGATVCGAHCNARARITVEVGGTLPQLGLQIRPVGLPGFDLTLPKLDFPNFAFPNSLPQLDLTGLLPVNLPLDARMDWTPGPAPTLQIGLVAGDLSFDSGPAANGRLLIGASAPPAPIANVTGFQASLANKTYTITTTLTAAGPVKLPDVALDGALTGPFVVRLMGTSVTPQVAVNGGIQRLTCSLHIARLEIRAREDPDAVLALAIAAQLTYDPAAPRTPHIAVTEVRLLDPYPLKLLATALELVAGGAQALYRFVSAIPLPSASGPALPDVGPLLNRLERLLTAALRWLAREAGAAGRALAALGGTVVDLLSALVRELRALKVGGSAPGAFVVELWFDAGNLALRQILLAPAHAAPSAGGIDDTLTRDVLGFRMAIPAAFRPALLYDLRDKRAALLLFEPGAGDLTASLSTDLWLAHTDGRAVAAPDAQPDDEHGARSQHPLVAVTAKLPQDTILALAVVGPEGATFFRSFRTFDQNDAGGALAPSRTVTVTDAANPTFTARVAPPLFRFDQTDQRVVLACTFNAAEVERLLPFLRKPKPEQGAGGSTGFGDKLAQYIKLKSPAVSGTHGADSFTIDLGVEIHLSDYKADATLQLTLDIRTLQARIRADNRIAISDDFNPGDSEKKDLFGLSAQIVPKNGRPGRFTQFVLDFTDGEPRLSLAEEARIELEYERVTREGRGIVFRADTLVVSGDGIDLVAETDPEQTVYLAGVDTAFRFKSGQLAVKRGEIQSFSLSGSGALPPALMGDASADVHIGFGRGADGRLVVLSAGGALDRSADPIVCDATRFHFTLSKIGFEVLEDHGYHFLFRVTGSAEFKPRAGEFTDGLLKYLGHIKLNLDRVPLVGDSSVIARHITLQVALDPPVAATLFDIFAFELRGIGFHPHAGAFGDAPAMSLSGQVRFGLGDIPSLDMEFHKMFIAPPAPGGSLPRVRFDGLTVGLSLGMARVRGTAIAVDDSLPSIYAPDVLPEKVTPKGFLASGTLGISGWPDMSASMGFLQLKQPQKEDRHAFFLFAQLNKLNEPIPTPIGTLYLREAGFGFGYRYTLAGLQRADTVERPQQLVALLDEVSKYQNDLANLRAWLPEPEGDRLTLAMRALFTVNTASPEGTYDAPREESPVEPPPNPVLFDFVAALRSDLTFLLSGRAFISVNYADWVKGAGQAWQQKPPLRGYMYISVPRKQFLARLVADPEGYIGDHPKLPEPLIMAMRASRWSSTLYIDETMFHQEFGWPYELGFMLKDDNGNFGLTAEGGTVLRIIDGAVLYGIAFRARGFACFSGSRGDSSLGASVEARADFAIEAKLIAYLSAARPADTFFYGALAIDLTLDFRVSFWLSFKVFGHEVRFSAGFSVSLTISVAVELVVAARNPMVGGRLKASIAVGAFGRTLRLGVGLSFSDAFLDETRQRVQRYMEIGLGVDHPDPEKGVPAPPPAPKRETSLKVGDEAVARAARDQQALNASPSPTPAQPDEIVGRELGQSDFWALLFPTAAGDYILQLVPRDHTALPGEAHFLADTAGSFYAPPDPAWLGQDPHTNKDQVVVRPADYKLSGFAPLPAGASMLLLKPDNTTQDMATSGDTQVNWNATVSVSDAGPLRLWRVVRECFLGVADGHFTEPTAENLVETPLPGDAVEAAAKLASASHQRDLLGAREAAEATIHERRSALIATICECAARLAVAVTPAGEIGLDARHFGLTFRVNAAALEALFGEAAREDAEAAATPPTSALTVATTGPARDGAGSVKLFNPPSRFFRRAQPRLARAEGLPGDGQIRLSWDLEPTWGSSKGVYHDPEFHLSCYQVERRFVMTGRPVPKPRVTTTKSGGQVYYGSPNGGGEARWQRFANRCQFVDDLSDLPDDWRTALRLSGDAAAADAQTRRDAWDRAFGTDHVRIEYSIAAVDIAGTMADPEVIVVDLPRPRRALAPLRRAALSFSYSHAVQAAGGASVGAPVLKMLLEDSIVDAAAKAALTAGRDIKADVEKTIDARLGRLSLRAAWEAAAGGGTYGVDAITQALGRPALPDPDDAPRAGEADFVLRRLKAGEMPREAIEVTVRITRPDKPAGYQDWAILRYAIAPADGGPDGTLAQWLGIDNDPRVRSARIYMRPAPPQPKPDDSFTSARWIAADLVLTFDGAGKDDPPAVETAVEQFEHPLKAEFGVLGFEDLDADGGPLVVRRTRADATLEKLLKGESAVLDRHRDPAGRVAVQLRWNARPLSLRLAGKQPDPNLAGLVAGYDLFSVDLDRVVRNLNTDEAITRMSRHEGRVRLTPRRLMGQEPSTTGDFAQIESFYPSAAAPQAAAGRGSALTQAESLVLWPQPVVRRLLLPNPPDEVIDDLFAKGAPAAIRLTLAAGPAPMGTMKLAVADPWDRPQVGLKSQDSQPVLTLPAPDGSGGRFTPGQLRAALRCLYWLRAPGDAKSQVDPWDEVLRDPAAAFGSQTLKIEALDASGTRMAQTEAALTLAGPLHGFLADTLDVLRFSSLKTGNGQRDFAGEHRRYEVVGEAPPQVKATDLTGLLEECPPQRDPHGWGLLRTLGLAASFRLYDADARDFVSAEDTLRHLKEALAFVSSIYALALPSAGARLGAPFVDILMRPDGLLEVGSFDGGAPVTPVQGLEAIGRHGLSLVQIALRPAADRLLPSDQPAEAGQGAAVPAAAKQVPYLVNYLAVRAKPLDKIPEKFVIGLVSSQPYHVIADVIDLTSRLARPRQATLASAALAAALDEGEPPPVFEVPAASDRLVAMVRIIAWDKDGKALNEDTLPGLIAVDPTLISVTLCGGPVQGDGAPIGAFAPLSGRRFALMAHGLPERKVPTVAPEVPPFAPVKESLKDLFALTRRFSPPKLAAIDQQTAFWTRLTAATERFLRHGPASAVPPAAREPLIAFATPLRPDPWRVVPGEDGRVGVLLLEKDRFGHRRRYAVRPFGRYADVVEAVEGRRPPSLAGAFALPGGGLDLRAFALAVISRSEPVAPPVILSARRVDEAPRGTPARPGELVELIIARHEEEAIAEANRGNEGGLAVREWGVGFWRQFAFEDWGKAFNALPADEWTAPDFAEAFGPFRNVSPDGVPPPLPAPAGVSIDATALQVTSRRHPDLRRGAHVMRLRALPYGFRLHALCYMASGAVVSKPTGATVEEAHYVLGLPWPVEAPSPAGREANAPDAVSPTPVFLPPPSEAPVWSVVETTGAATRRLAIDLPLVRVLDMMDSKVRDLWFGTGAAPRMLQLPDPGVQYRFSLDTGAYASQPELNVVGRTSSTPEGLYLLQYSGTRFADPAVRARPKWKPTFGTFVLRLEADIVGGAVRAEDPPPLQPGALLEGLQLDALIVPPKSLASWLPFAAQAPHRLQIALPPQAGPAGPVYPWDQLRAAATAMRAAIAPYVAVSPPTSAVRQLNLVLARLEAIQNDADWPYPPTHGQYDLMLFGWPAGVPRPSSRPILMLNRVTDWVWPEITDGCRAQRRRLEDGLSGATGLDATTILGPLRAAMRRRAVALAHIREFAPCGTLAPHRAVLGQSAGAFEPLANAMAEHDPQPIATSIGLMRRLQLIATPPAVARDPLDAAFAALEALNASGAMEALGMLEEAGTGPVTLSFLLAVRHAQPALNALAALGALTRGELEVLVLSQPPLDAELAAAREVLSANPGAITVLENAAQEHLFGPARHLGLEVIKGLAAPHRQTVKRRP